MPETLVVVMSFPMFTFRVASPAAFASRSWPLRSEARSSSALRLASVFFSLQRNYTREETINKPDYRAQKGYGLAETKIKASFLCETAAAVRLLAILMGTPKWRQLHAI